MNGSIRPFSMRLTLVVLILTLTAPLISSGQDAEAEAKAKTNREASPNADPAPQDDDVLESIGVSPNPVTTDTTSQSSLDRKTSPFDDSVEIVDDSTEQGQPDGIETTDSRAADSPSDSDSVTATDKLIVPESNRVPASVASPEVNNEPAIPNTSPESVPTQASSAQPAITLDELLRQARKTPHFKQEALHARLAERRRLAIAMRATLEAAQQVAAYGHAGTQLLRDASLDTIVSTMIADKERERLNEVLQTTAAPTSSSVNLVVAPPETTSDVKAGFDTWRAVYIVLDEQGQRIGWRHSSSGKRKSAYVGESLMFDDDDVAIVGVSAHMGRRYLTIDLNGERRDIPLF